MSEQRLDRIEKNIDRLVEKVDDMTEVVTALARIEEKHVAVAQRLDHHDNRLNKHSSEIDDLQKTATRNSIKTDGSEWFMRLVIGSVIGLVVYLVRG